MGPQRKDSLVRGFVLDPHSFAIAAVVVVFAWCCFAATLWLRAQLAHLEDES